MKGWIKNRMVSTNDTGGDKSLGEREGDILRSAEKGLGK
jgi:hypothetical protein